MPGEVTITMPRRFNDGGSAWRFMCNRLCDLGVFPRNISRGAIGFVFSPDHLIPEVLDLIDRCERAGCVVER